MSTRKNIKTVQALYQAFGTGAVEEMLNLLTDDVVFEMPKLPDLPLKQRYRGKAGFRRFLKDRAPNIEYDKFLPREFVAQGDVVVVLGETSGRALPTGKRFRHQWAQVFRFRDGKIGGVQEFLTTAEISSAFRAEP